MKQMQFEAEITNLVYFLYSNKWNHFACKCLLVSLLLKKNIWYIFTEPLRFFMHCYIFNLGAHMLLWEKKKLLSSPGWVFVFAQHTELVSGAE